MLYRLYHSLDRRLRLSVIAEALKTTRPDSYLSPLDGPPFSPGRLTLITLVILLVSGLGLTLFYVPNAETASASLAQLHSTPAGRLLHNLHRWSALMVLALVVLHALRVWLSRAYVYPRDLNWWLGLGLLGWLFLMGGTGYLLRWDIKAFALMDLVISNLSDIPVLGPVLITLLLGGNVDGAVPLYRGYALHIWFLPVVLALLLACHLLVVWRQGLHSLPRWLPRHSGGRQIRLLPGLLLAGLLVLLALTTPDGDPNNPAARFLWPHPDWLLMIYFLPFWFFKGDSRLVGALVVPALLLLFLVFAPRFFSLARVRTGGAVLLAVLGTAAVVWLFTQTARMGQQVPLPGCPACHRPTIVGDAPARVADFKIRDPDWVVFHLTDPQGSLLVPFTAPLGNPP